MRCGLHSSRMLAEVNGVEPEIRPLVGQRPVEVGQNQLLISVQSFAAADFEMPVRFPAAGVDFRRTASVAQFRPTYHFRARVRYLFGHLPVKDFGALFDPASSMALSDRFHPG